MAGYRQFHTQFWKDEWLIDLEPLERYLFSYLFTNDLSSISGIYKLPLRVIQNETGLDKDFIITSLAKFQSAKKLFYQDGVVWIVNMRKYHKNASPRTMTKVNGDVGEIPDCDVKTAYLYYEQTGIYSIDIVSIQCAYSAVKEKEKEKAKAKAEEEAKAIPQTSQLNIFELFEREIGILTPFISEELMDIEKEFPGGWFEKAVREAKRSSSRVNLKYISAILTRWKADGLPAEYQDVPQTKREYQGILIDGVLQFQEVHE